MNAEGFHQLQPRVDARSAATLGNNRTRIATLKGLHKVAGRSENWDRRNQKCRRRIYL